MSVFQCNLSHFVLLHGLCGREASLREFLILMHKLQVNQNQSDLESYCSIKKIHTHSGVSFRLSACAHTPICKRACAFSGQSCVCDSFSTVHFTTFQSPQSFSFHLCNQDLCTTQTVYLYFGVMFPSSSPMLCSSTTACALCVMVANTELPVEPQWLLLPVAPVLKVATSKKVKF